MNTPPKARRLRPGWRLVPHEIRFRRVDVVDKPHAHVECERKQCSMSVEECAYCERFARIDVHEAGYTLLCRPDDEEV